MKKLKNIVNSRLGFLKKYHLDLLSAFVLTLTLFFLYPIGVYQRNIGAISFNLNDIWRVLLGFALGVFIIIAFLGVIIHKFLYDYIGVIFSSIILVFWVQGNLLVYDIGTLDGHAIDWGIFRGYYIVEIVIWVGIITLAIWFRKIVYRKLSTLLVLLLIFEVVPLLITGFEQSFYDKADTSLYINYEREFEFSSDQNVLIIVLDTTRADAFEQVLARNPVYRDSFKDFTYFKNTLSGFPSTKPSIPLILSGEHYDSSIPFTQYIEDTQKKSLPALLKANGYAVEYYSFAPYAYMDIWDNTSVEDSRNNLLTSTEKLYLVTFLRYLPLPLKPLMVEQYYKGGSYWGRDIVDFYNNSVKTSSADKNPVFKFVHLTGAHPPFLLDNFLQFSPDNSYLNQYEGALLAVDKLLQEMKATKVYDNSLILVMGDHGSLDTWDVQDGLRSSSTSVMLNGMPLLLIKGFHQKQNELVISNAPVSLGDIPKSVMAALNLDNKLPGLSVFADIPENRSRFFYYYLWQQVDWNSEFLPPLYIFQVNGNVRDPNSWQFKGKENTNSGQLDLLPFYYQYGENIVSESNPYLKLFSSGFSGQGSQSVWATGPYSCIYLPIKRNDSPLSLSFSVMPFLDKEHLTQQKINIMADNQLIKTLQLSSGAPIVLPLPAKLTNNNELNLCFEFPDAKYSPRDLGMSNDSRYLGGLFQSLSINEILSFSLPIEFNFGEKGNATTIKGGGWSNPETEYTWTEGHNAQLFLYFAPDDAENIKMTISAFPLVVGKKLEQQLVIVRSNGVELGQWTIDHDGEYAVNISSDYIKNSFLTIDFEIPNATSPSSLGISQDARTLGVAVRWLRLEEQ